ncbi:MAG TPA: ATP-binding protein [Coleofasciculaceae cyanobacterium]|jgi:PAS domain S-box-containing protein
MNNLLRVLLVEDSEDDAELLVHELERGGYNPIYERVDTPAAMSTALDKEQWDIIIADYTLPSFSAPAALNLLKEKELDLPFIIVSGSIGEDIAVAAMKAGAHDYLMKDKLARLAPAVERELREAIERRRRREAEQTVRQNEERFRALIENALDIITVLGTNGIISYNSSSIKKVLGYEPEHLVGKNILEYIHPEDVAKFIYTLNQTVQNPNIALTIEFRFQHQNGSWRILEAVGKNFVDSTAERDAEGSTVQERLQRSRNEHRTLPSGVSSIVLNSRDITERKQAEEIRHALERERELSEERFNFVSMMSHEFRNPLSTILMACEVLQNYSHKTTQEKKHRCLNNIENSAQEMAQLLDDILTLAKAEVRRLKFNPKPINLADFCNNILESMPMVGGGKHNIRLLIRDECNQAFMDATLLKHILTNLLSNAIKYSPNGGDIRFEISCQDGEAIFKIRDQGIGIPLQDQQGLFESFHRAGNVGQIPGTGLGLTIVKKFVDMHGGKIALNSEVGVGTTLTVTLPSNIKISIEEPHDARAVLS